MSNMIVTILTLSAAGLGFAAGSSYSTARAESAQAVERSAAPVEYFPARFEVQAKEVEAPPSQF